VKGVVIGGTKGLGKALVETLPGAIPVARTSKQYRLDLNQEYRNVYEQSKRIFSQIGHLDYLVISSGRGAYLSFTEMIDSDRIKALFTVNAISPIAVYTAARKHLIRSQGKCIFVTSSVAEHGARGLSVYAATKGALNSFVKSEARTAAKLGYSVCAIAPGWFISDMTKDIQPELKKAIIRYIPEKRMAEAKEIAEFIEKLISTSNWNIQGQIFYLTGGY